MSFTAEIDVSAVVRLADMAGAMGPVVADEIRGAMTESGMLLTTLVAGRTPVNYGILRSSISWPQGFRTSGDAESELRGFVQAGDQRSLTGASTQRYANFVEYGRRPGRWPPAEPIQLWAMRKLGLRGEELERATFLIRRKIGVAGTAGAHMFKRAWNDAGRDGTQRIWNRVPERVVRRWAAMIG